MRSFSAASRVAAAGGVAGRAWRLAAILLVCGAIAPPPVPAGGASPSVSAGRGDDVRLPGNARVSERLFGLPGLSNVGRVAPGILRGAQPRPGGYETLRRAGVRTVVNLRLRHGEKEAVEAAGMRSVEIGIDSMKNVDPAAVRKVLAVLTDPENRPVFVHCAQGKDRTGIVVAAYRMEVEGWTREEAEAEMESFGFHDVWLQLRRFVRNYPGDRAETGVGAGR